MLPPLLLLLPLMMMTTRMAPRGCRCCRCRFSRRFPMVLSPVPTGVAVLRCVSRPVHSSFTGRAVTSQESSLSRCPEKYGVCLSGAPSVSCMKARRRPQSRNGRDRTQQGHTLHVRCVWFWNDSPLEDRIGAVPRSPLNITTPSTLTT